MHWGTHTQPVQLGVVCIWGACAEGRTTNTPVREYFLLLDQGVVRSEG